MSTPIQAEELQALIDWYRAMGVAEFTADQPTDWRLLAERMRDTAAAHRAENAPPRRAAAPSAPLRAPPPDRAASDALAAAATATTLAELGAALEVFDGCGLKATAKSLCFYRGAAAARLMLIGEAPGRDEDIAGKPFVGRAGRLLDKMLQAIGIDEAACHITNIVYWRPPGNRTPMPREAAACAPFLARQIELVGPEIIVLLGGAATKQLLDTADGILKLRGRWRQITIAGRAIETLATLHPAYLLRAPAQKRLAWRDMLMIEAALGP